MNTEISAGGIIIYRSKEDVYVLLMKDMKGNWTFPKGKIEKDEAIFDAAAREIEEEVGLIDLSLIAELPVSTYWYFRQKFIKKNVHYFLFQSKTKQKPTVQKEEGITEAKWVMLKEALQCIGYPKTNLPLLNEANTYLKK